MEKGFVHSLWMCIMAICFCQIVNAASLPVTDANKPKYDLNHPTDWLEIGGDFRFRYQYDNNRKLDNQATGHDRSQFRLRARTWAKFKLTPDLDFNVRLASEPRYYVTGGANNKTWEYNEALIDIFNLTWRNAFNQPLTVVAGRQEIILGSGWLVCDGTPLDGSRTAFFDALRFTYNLDSNMTMDVVLIDDHANPAAFLDPINNQSNDLSEQDESGAIVYLTKKFSKDFGIDGYFIYKHDTHQTDLANSDEGEIYTLGTRLFGNINKNWCYSTEFAPQFGHKNGDNLGAFGANNQLVYNFNDEHKNKLYFGYEYLSGNKYPNQNFDRGWGRVDTWSVLYQGNIDGIDGRVFDNSNLHRFYTEWETNLTEKLSWRNSFSLLFADENTFKAGTNGLSEHGKFRGPLLRTMFKYKMTKAIEHRIEGEIFLPGNFYQTPRNNVAALVRYSLYYTW